MVIQQLRLYAAIAVGLGLIPGQGSKILLATWLSQKEK